MHAQVFNAFSGRGVYVPETGICKLSMLQPLVYPPPAPVTTRPCVCGAYQWGGLYLLLCGVLTPCFSWVFTPGPYLCKGIFILVRLVTNLGCVNVYGGLDSVVQFESWAFASHLLTVV